MLLSATLGPLELWAFSTTAEDVSIRNRLYERLGPRQARKVLAYAYPDGTARDDIEERKVRMKDRGVIVDGKATNVIEAIVDDLIDLNMRLN